MEWEGGLVFGGVLAVTTPAARQAPEEPPAALALTWDPRRVQLEKLERELAALDVRIDGRRQPHARHVAWQQSNHQQQQQREDASPLESVATGGSSPAARNGGRAFLRVLPPQDNARGPVRKRRLTAAHTIDDPVVRLQQPPGALQHAQTAGRLQRGAGGAGQGAGGGMAVTLPALRPGGHADGPSGDARRSGGGGPRDQPGAPDDFFDPGGGGDGFGTTWAGAPTPLAQRTPLALPPASAAGRPPRADGARLLQSVTQKVPASGASRAPSVPARSSDSAWSSSSSSSSSSPSSSSSAGASAFGASAFGASASTQSLSQPLSHPSPPSQGRPLNQKEAAARAAAGAHAVLASRDALEASEMPLFEMPQVNAPAMQPHVPVTRAWPNLATLFALRALRWRALRAGPCCCCCCCCCCR